MAITALDLITKAFIRIGIYGIGETLDAGDATYTLDTLNEMMDSWSNEALFCYAYLNQSGVLVPGQAAYTIGTSGGADFPIQRPTRMGTKTGTAYVQDDNGNNYQMTVVQQDRWNMISNRVTTNSNFPDTLFYDPQFPLGIMNVFPVPTISYTMFWSTLLMLEEFPDLTTVLTLPPGYQQAITDGLACRIWPDYKTAEVSQSLQAQFAVSKGAIKRTNKREVLALFDPEILGKGSRYNIYNDNFSPR